MSESMLKSLMKRDEDAKQIVSEEQPRVAFSKKENVKMDRVQSSVRPTISEFLEYAEDVTGLSRARIIERILNKFVIDNYPRFVPESERKYHDLP